MSSEQLAVSDKYNALLTHAEIESSGSGVLGGMKYVLKDNIMVKGVKCTAGSKILENYIATYDATVVTRLKSSGAKLIGKANMDEFAMGSSTENSAYGVVKNPHDISRVAGGSSGGSAVSVASGMADFALGSDTGGSIRQPASFCGVVGFKPTYGRVSRYGLIAMASSLDQIGTFTNTVEDAAKVLSVIGGHDPLDATSSPVVQPNYLDALAKTEGMTIGIPKEYFMDGLEDGVSSSVNGAIKELEKAGFKIKEISLKHTKYALAVYYVIMPVEVASNLSRYDGVKYGYSVEREDDAGDLNISEVTMKSRAKGFGMEAKRRIMLGTYASSSGYYDAYYIKAQQVRTLVLKDFEDAFKDVDIIATPTTPEVAFKIGAKSADPVKMYLSDILTVPANIAGIPAISVPCGMSDGLPVGLQLMSAHFTEDKLLNVAHRYEKVRGEFSKPEGV